MNNNAEINKKAFSDTLKYVGISLAVIILCGLLFGAAIIFEHKNNANTPVIAQNYPCVIIDAGHGGEDGGASDANGNPEKDINLAVASMTADYLRFCGVNVIMTREDDRLLYDKYGDLTDYTGHKKMYDLKNRLRVAAENENCIFVSIHMNTYPSVNVRGLQTWYSPNNAYSEQLARTVQTHVKTYIGQTGAREIKNGGKQSYLLQRLTLPSVIVECGFLSNPEEAALLQTDEHRRKLAVCTGAAVINFLDCYTNQG